jgi:hypothetical protein
MAIALAGPAVVYRRVQLGEALLACAAWWPGYRVAKLNRVLAQRPKTAPERSQGRIRRQKQVEQSLEIMSPWNGESELL